MSKDHPHVLAIDDDEVILAALADLLEAARFRVSYYASPAGAAELAASGPALAAVVLDLNMPIMRGENLARMFLSRASLRDIPIVFLSGETPATLSQVRTTMPNARIVPKVYMQTSLVPTLREVIAERTQRAGPRAWGSEPSAGTGPYAAAQARFYARLGAEMDIASEAWRDARASKLAPALKLAAVLRSLQVEANANGLLQAGRLLGAMEQIALALYHGAKLRPSADSSMQRAIDALVAVARDKHPGDGFTLDTIADAVRRAALTLCRTKRE